jgi:membrane-associated phospholipid phosphatase
VRAFIRLVVHSASLAVAIALTTTSARMAHADAPMRDATVLEAASIFAVGATALAFDVFAPSSATPRWTGPILFDDGARNALAAKTDDGRARAGRASDIAVGLLVAGPFVDALASALWAHRIDDHTAFELAVTDLEAFSVTEALTVASKRAFSRQRPDAQESGCDGTGGAAPARGATSTSDTNGCAHTDRNSSFWSGHTAEAFTSAALQCTEHLRLHLYGEPWDAFACTASLSAATVTGAFRIVADRHWASDVVVGAAVGSLSGWLVPTLLRFRASSSDAATSAIVPIVAPVAGGATLGIAAVGW